MDLISRERKRLGKDSTTKLRKQTPVKDTAGCYDRSITEGLLVLTLPAPRPQSQHWYEQRWAWRWGFCSLSHSTLWSNWMGLGSGSVFCLLSPAACRSCRGTSTFPGNRIRVIDFSMAQSLPGSTPAPCMLLSCLWQDQTRSHPTLEEASSP